MQALMLPQQHLKHCLPELAKLPCPLLHERRAKASTAKTPQGCEMLTPVMTCLEGQACLAGCEASMCIFLEF
jgi:hypothetical protein